MKHPVTKLLTLILFVGCGACSPKPKDRQSIKVEWHHGGTTATFSPLVFDGNVSSIDGIELRVVGDVVQVGDRRYAPIRAGDQVTITDDGVSINGVPMQPLP